MRLGIFVGTRIRTRHIQTHVPTDITYLRRFRYEITSTITDVACASNYTCTKQACVNCDPASICACVSVSILNTWNITRSSSKRDRGKYVTNTPERQAWASPGKSLPSGGSIILSKDASSKFNFNLECVHEMGNTVALPMPRLYQRLYVNN